MTISIASPRGLSGITGVLFLVFSYPVISMIWRHQYAVISTEVFLLFSLIAAFSIVLALLARAVSTLVGNMMLSICITFVFVLQFDLLLEQLGLWVPIIFGLAFITGRNFVRLALYVFVAMIIGSFVDAKLDHSSQMGLGEIAPVHESKPLVVHVLMDEFIGPDGLPPQDISQQLRTDILTFFLDNGFEIFGKAYSHYHATQDSLSHAFQLQSGSFSSAQLAVIFHKALSVTQNRYFKLLHDRGYSINIYQTDLVDFCNAVPEAVNRCRVYTMPNLDSVATDIQSPWLRIRALMAVLIKQSSLLQQTLNTYLHLDSQHISHYQPAVIEEMLGDLEKNRGGLYFAHLLLPHSPYVYRADCQLDYDSEEWERLPVFGGEIANNPDTRAVRYIRYIEQTRCALRELQRLFDGMRRMGIYDQATIVVHGDHGSRISLRDAVAENIDLLTPEDYRDLFSTLFAFRQPAGEPKIRDEVISLNVLLAQILSRVTGSEDVQLSEAATNAGTPFIYLSKQIPLLKKEIDIFEEQ